MPDIWSRDVDVADETPSPEDAESASTRVSTTAARNWKTRQAAQLSVLQYSL